MINKIKWLRFLFLFFALGLMPYMGHRRKAFTGESWTTSWTGTDYADSDAYGDYTIRCVLGNADISTSGTSIRVTLKAGTGQALNLDNVAIVERSGSTSNGTTTPTEILFSAGSGVNISAGNTALSDELSYTIDNSKDYLVILDVGSSGAADTVREVTAATTNVGYYKAATNSYNTQNLDSPTQRAYSWSVVKLEVK